MKAGIVVRKEVLFEAAEVIMVSFAREFLVILVQSNLVFLILKLIV